MAVVRYKFKFEDKTPAFKQRLALAFDKSIEHIMIDVETLAIAQAPVDQGQLIRSRRSKRVAPAHWELSFGGSGAPYARRWHYEYPKTWKEEPPTPAQRRAFFARLGEGKVQPSMGGGTFRDGRKTHYLERPGRIVGQRAATYVRGQLNGLGEFTSKVTTEYGA